MWEELHTQIELLRSDMNCQIFDDLLTFVSGCHRQHENNRDQKYSGEIPAAVLVTGVNTPDHDIMFSNLQTMLKSKLSPLVARVHCDDNSKINTLLSNIIAQIMNITLSAEEKDDDPDEKDNSPPSEQTANIPSSPFKLKANPKHNRKSLNLTSLVKWYKRTFQRNAKTKRAASCSPKKKSKTDNLMDVDVQLPESNKDESSKDDRPLLVIVFEDVESVNPSVFQDFISLCSSYLSSLPIVLILGIATAVTAIHQVLPSAITSLMCMETFQVSYTQVFILCNRLCFLIFCMKCVVNKKKKLNKNSTLVLLKS